MPHNDKLKSEYLKIKYSFSWISKLLKKNSKKVLEFSKKKMIWRIK